MSNNKEKSEFVLLKKKTWLFENTLAVHIEVNGLNPRIWHLERSQFRQLSIPSAFQTASKSKISKLKSSHKSHNFNFCVA